MLPHPVPRAQQKPAAHVDILAVSKLPQQKLLPRHLFQEQHMSVFPGVYS